MREKVTIQDIARRAGVSASTVSRTLHDHPKITAETKRRVLEAAEELHYKSTIYPTLSSSARLLAIVLPNAEEELLRHPFFTSVLRGVSLAAQARGYLVTYGFAASHTEKMEILTRCLSTPAVRGFVLLRAYQNDPGVDALIAQDVPFSLIGRPESSQDILWVDNDNFHAAYDAVNHLIENGCRRIAFVGGPESMTVTRDRLEGYRMALTNRGLQFDDALVGFAEAFGEPGGFQSMRRMLAQCSPDSLLASDDYLAMGALRAAKEHGSHDLQCVGFNNTELSPHSYPPFSSVEIYPEQLGRHAATLVLERIENGDNDERHVVVPTRLVVRGTLAQTAPTGA